MFYGIIGDNKARSLVASVKVVKNGYILSHYAKYASDMTRVKIETNDTDVIATVYIDLEESVIAVVLLNYKTVVLMFRLQFLPKLRVLLKQLN